MDAVRRRIGEFFHKTCSAPLVVIQIPYILTDWKRTLQVFALQGKAQHKKRGKELNLAP